MDNQGHLAVIQARAAVLGSKAIANEEWLTKGFLGDTRFTPQRYLDEAERHKSIQRTLFALTEVLLIEARPRLVA
jgi:hypothetical protein